MAERQDLPPFVLGETWPLSGVVRDADGETIALPPGSAVRVAIGAVVDLEAEITDADAGEWSLRIEPADQEDVQARTYPYEVRAFIAGGHVTTQNFGDVTIQPSLFPAEA